MSEVHNREGAKNSGGKTAGPVPVRCIQVNRRPLPPLAPLSLTTQVPDQWISLVSYLSGQTLGSQQWK